MVETVPVVGVLEREAALDLVSLDHGLEDILDDKGLEAGLRVGLGSTGDPISHGEDTTEIVRGVTPLSSEPAVIVVQPTDSSTNVEGTTDRVEGVWCTRDLASVRDDGT